MVNPCASLPALELPLEGEEGVDDDEVANPCATPPSLGMQGRSRSWPQVGRQQPSRLDLAEGAIEDESVANPCAQPSSAIQAMVVVQGQEQRSAALAPSSSAPVPMPPFKPEAPSDPIPPSGATAAEPEPEPEEGSVAAAPAPGPATSLRCFVGNLPHRVTDDDIRAVFADCGNLLSIHRLLDEKSGRFYGSCFLEFTLDADGEQAGSEGVLAKAMSKAGGSRLVCSFVLVVRQGLYHWPVFDLGRLNKSEARL